jgi:hypothetical protein
MTGDEVGESERPGRRGPGTSARELSSAWKGH